MPIQLDFNKFSDDELFELNKNLVEHVRLRHEARSQTALAKLHVGDRVYFKTDGDRKITGTIIRINRKTITLHADDHIQWKVSPGLLCKINEAKSNSSKKTNIFSLKDRNKKGN